MRALTWAALTAGALACAAAPRQEIRVETDDLGRYRRVGVVPFRDAGGLGREYAEAMSRGLAELGFEAVDMARLEASFRERGLDPAGTLPPEELPALRRGTGADALLFGAVEEAQGEARRVRGLTLVMLDAVDGDVVLRAALHPTGLAAGGGAGSVVDYVVLALKRELRLEDNRK